MHLEGSPASILRKGLGELLLSYTRGQIDAFMTYLSELKRWNRTYNLTALKTDGEIVVKHFLDSLLYLDALPGGEISVMDVGSGAGFPGIPVKIMRPEISMYLLEPSRKKTGFLLHMIKTLKLERVQVIGKRIEEMKQLSADAALTRALFSVSEFYKKASPFVREGGRIILSKGPKVHDELKEIKGTRYELLTLRLPCSEATRFIVVIEKETCGRKGASGHAARSKSSAAANICFNTECRLRKAGCKGFEGCPGFKGKD